MHKAIIEAKLLSISFDRNIIHFSLTFDNYVINDIVYDRFDNAFVFEDKLIKPSLHGEKTKCLLMDLLWKLLHKQEPVLYVGAAWCKTARLDESGIIVSLNSGIFEVELNYQGFTEKDVQDLKEGMQGDLESLKKTFATLIADVNKEVDFIMSEITLPDLKANEQRAVTSKASTIIELEDELNGLIVSGYDIKSNSICFDGTHYCSLTIIEKREDSSNLEKMGMF